METKIIKQKMILLLLINMGDYEPEDYEYFKGEPEYENLYNEMGDYIDDEIENGTKTLDYDYYSNILNSPPSFLREQGYTKEDLDLMVQGKNVRQEMETEKLSQALQYINSNNIQPSIIQRIKELKNNYEIVCKKFKKGKEICKRYYTEEQVKEQIFIEEELINIINEPNFPDTIKEETLNPFIVTRFGSNECFIRDILDTQLLYWQLQSREEQLNRKQQELQEAGQLMNFMNLIMKLKKQISKRSLFSKRKVDTTTPYGTPEQLLQSNSYNRFQELVDKFESGEFINEYEFKYNLYDELKRVLSGKSKLTYDEIDFLKQLNSIDNSIDDDNDVNFPIILNSFPKKEDKREMYNNLLLQIKLSKKSQSKRAAEIKKLKKWFLEYNSPIYSGEEYRLLEKTVKYYNFKGALVKGKGRKKQIIWSREMSGLMPDEWERFIDMRDSLAEEIEKQKSEYKSKLAKEIISYTGYDNRFKLGKCIMKTEEPEKTIDESNYSTNYLPDSFIKAAHSLNIRKLIRFKKFFNLKKRVYNNPKYPFKVIPYSKIGTVEYIKKTETEILEEHMRTMGIIDDILVDVPKPKSESKLILEEVFKPPNLPEKKYITIDGKMFDDRDKYIFHKTIAWVKFKIAQQEYIKLHNIYRDCVNRIIETHPNQELILKLKREIKQLNHNSEYKMVNKLLQNVEKLQNKINTEIGKKCKKPNKSIQELMKLVKHGDVQAYLNSGGNRDVCVYFYIRSKEIPERKTEFTKYIGQLNCDEISSLMSELELTGKRSRETSIVERKHKK
jgi:regulator of replication initiation timing